MTCMWILNNKRLNWTIWKCIVKGDVRISVLGCHLELGRERAFGVFVLEMLQRITSVYLPEENFLFPSPPLLSLDHQPTLFNATNTTKHWFDFSKLNSYLFIGFWIRHRGFTHTAGQPQTSSSGLLVVCLRVSLLKNQELNYKLLLEYCWAYHLLQLGGLLCSLLLGLDLLLSSGHF